jgi:glycosyl hydrolase family 1
MPHALPVIDSPEHVKAAEAATRELNRYFMGPMLEGRYDDAYLKSAGKGAPKFTDAEMKIVGAPLDFVGINVYIPTLLVMASDQPPGYREVPFNDSHPKMFSRWHRLAPEFQYWSPRLLHSIWKPKEIYITENGCGASDVVADDGNVYDSDRLMYLRNGMMHQQRAAAEGIPLKGNFVWSAMGQFRVERRLRHAVRNRVRGLQDAEAHAEAQRAVVPRSGPTQCRGVTPYVTYTYPAPRALFVTGRFLTVVPAPVPRLPVKDSALRVLPVDLPTTRKPIAIITLKNRTLGPVAELFIKNARAMARSLGPRT